MTSSYDITSLINDLHHEDLRNESHPSLFDVNPGYDMLIIRLPIFDESLRIESVGFIITEERSYLYDKSAGKFKSLGDRFDGPYRTIDPLLDKLLRTVSAYPDQIADMEELLYADRAGSDFMTDWLGLKRDILRIERIMIRTAETLKEVVEYYEPLTAFPVDNYADLHEHADRIVRSATLQLSKLDYINNFHSARTNEKMNRMIYLLTIISAIFLPLNLVVGFFGMNTGGLPFSHDDNGTIGAVALMLTLFVITSGILYVWHDKRVKTTE